ncbi:MAG: LysR family transcriptional regulator, partial [Oscillospiraceae bacterium]
MDVKQMTYILTIAEEGGITKAANKLFITQSALDQQLLKLENELGVQLFTRGRGNFPVTAAGMV